MSQIPCVSSQPRFLRGGKSPKVWRCHQRLPGREPGAEPPEFSWIFRETVGSFFFSKPKRYDTIIISNHRPLMWETQEYDFGDVFIIGLPLYWGQFIIGFRSWYLHDLVGTSICQLFWHVLIKGNVTHPKMRKAAVCHCLRLYVILPCFGGWFSNSSIESVWIHWCLASTSRSCERICINVLDVWPTLSSEPQPYCNNI